MKLTRKARLEADWRGSRGGDDTLLLRNKFNIGGADISHYQEYILAGLGGGK